MSHAKEIVDEFHKAYLNAARRILASLFASLPWQPLENFTMLATGPAYLWEERQYTSSSPSWTLVSKEGGNIMVEPDAHQFLLCDQLLGRPEVAPLA